MFEMHLRQSGFIYSAHRLCTKKKERIIKLRRFMIYLGGS